MQQAHRQFLLSKASVNPGELEGAPVYYEVTATVGPMVSTRWNQGNPYNLYCPTACGSSTNTGCVATATAQIMKYWNYPTHGIGSHGYAWDGCGGKTLSANFSDAYDWSNMPNQLSSSSSQTQKAAVAELCYEVGVAVEMDYGRNGSGAYITGTAKPSAHTALVTYFGYSSIMRDEYRSNYNSDNDWFAVFKNEVDSKRPALLGIFGPDGGHAVVVDGYQTGGENLVHINMGWGGYCDDYYALNNIKCAHDFTYSNKQIAVIEILPKKPLAEVENVDCQASLCPGTTATLKALVKNKGVVSFPEDTNVIFMVKGPNEDSYHEIGTENAAGLNPDNDAWYSFDWNVPVDSIPGTYSLKVKVKKGDERISSPYLKPFDITLDASVVALDEVNGGEFVC